MTGSPRQKDFGDLLDATENISTEVCEIIVVRYNGYSLIKWVVGYYNTVYLIR